MGFPQDAAGAFKLERAHCCFIFHQMDAVQLALLRCRCLISVLRQKIHNMFGDFRMSFPRQSMRILCAESFQKLDPQAGLFPDLSEDRVLQLFALMLPAAGQIIVDRAVISSAAVEQDLSVGRPPLEACKMSIEYLKSIGL